MRRAMTWVYCDPGNPRRPIFGRVFQNELASVFNRDQFFEPAFAHQRSTRENSDAVADFLDLSEQMRRQQHGDAALLKIDNDIANVARAGGIDATAGKHCERDQEEDRPGPHPLILGMKFSKANRRL